MPMPTLSDTVRPTSHNVERRTKQYTPTVTRQCSRIASIGSVWFQS